eukprot:gene9205-9372_t
MPDLDYRFDGTGSSSEEETARKRVRSRKQAAAKPKRPPRRPAGLVSLRQLVDEGVLAAAEDVLTVEYKGTVTHASLTADGKIKWKATDHDFAPVPGDLEAVEENDVILAVEGGGAKHFMSGRLLRVERAFPVREAMASGAANDGINVEMDPEDQFKVEEMQAVLAAKAAELASLQQENRCNRQVITVKTL